MKRILILGAGAAGLIVANKLARELRREIARGELEVKILDKNDISTNQGGFTFLPFGLYSSEDITMARGKLISPRVHAIFGSDGEINNIDLLNREVTVKSGKMYRYDYLLIATGCRGCVDDIDGLSKDFNSFYTSLEDALHVKDLIRNFEKGNVVVLTVDMPIPCPGAPSKFTILLDDYLRYIKGEGERKKTTISFLWPIELIGPPAYNTVITKEFKKRNIKDVRKFKFAKVDESKKEIISSKGRRVNYDLLITIPPHKGIQPLMDSNITDEKGWIPTNKYTLQYSKSPNEHYDEVYAIGDAGSPDILKTGIGAHYQALITAQNLINDIRGIGVKVPYRGETGCPIVGSSYTPYTKGEAYLASWLYNKPLENFALTKLGWFIYRMYYYIYWDTTVKALL